MDEKIELENETALEAQDGEVQQKEKLFSGKDIYDVLQVFLQSTIIITLLFLFVFRFSVVNGHSMNPTLETQDWVIISNIGFNVQRGAVVVVSQPNSLEEVLIKRIIALPGETVDITADGYVTIDGQKIEESYVSALIKERGDIAFPHTVPENYVFVMGDNRNDSFDSRFGGVGDIDLRYVVGEAKFRLFPFGKPTIQHVMDYGLQNSSTGEINE